MLIHISSDGASVVQDYFFGCGRYQFGYFFPIEEMAMNYKLTWFTIVARSQDGISTTLHAWAALPFTLSCQSRDASYRANREIGATRAGPTV